VVGGNAVTSLVVHLHHHVATHRHNALGHVSNVQHVASSYLECTKQLQNVRWWALLLYVYMYIRHSGPEVSFYTSKRTKMARQLCQQLFNGLSVRLFVSFPNNSVQDQDKPYNRVYWVLFAPACSCLQPTIGSAAGDFSSLCYNLCCIANNHHKGAAAYTTHKK